MKIALLDTKTYGEDIDLSAFQQFGEVEMYKTTTPEQVRERMQSPIIVVTNKVVVDAEAIQHAKNLKLISVAATGIANVDIDAAKEANIAVTNVAGYSTESVAQHTFTLLFSLLGHTSYYDQYVKGGEYQQNDVFTHLKKPFWELKGKRFGIIGLGTIGKRVAEIATVFGCEVVYYSTSGKNDNDQYQRSELEELLRTCDVVSIHAPLTERTQDLIGFQQLQQMQPHAILLNTGRGGIVNEADLAHALDNNLLAGAGLDVFSEEPIAAGNPLLRVKKKEKLALTPHIAWTSVEARQRLIHEVVENVKAFLREEGRDRVV